MSTGQLLASGMRYFDLRGGYGPGISYETKFQKPYGIDVFGDDLKGQAWQDSTIFSIDADPFTIKVQDVWKPEVSIIDGVLQVCDHKFKLVLTLLNAAREQLGSDLCINFASANLMGQVSPSQFADNWVALVYGVEIRGVNTLLEEIFVNPDNARGRFGIIVLDFPDSRPELLWMMVRTNFSQDSRTFGLAFHDFHFHA